MQPAPSRYRPSPASDNNSGATVLRLLRATLNSWNGLRAAAQSEQAFREEIVALLIAVPAAFLLATETWRRVMLIAVVVLLMIAFVYVWRRGALAWK